MGYVFLVLLIVTGLTTHVVIDRFVRMMSAGVRQSGIYLVATFAIMICYSALCLAAPSPVDLHFYWLFAGAIFIDFAWMALRERRLYRHWQTRPPDAVSKARQALRIVTPLLGLLLVVNSVTLVIYRGVPSLGGGTPAPSLGPSFTAARPTSNGLSALAIVDGRTDPAKRTFNFTAVVDLTSLTKASPALDPKKAFGWTLTNGLDFSPLHPSIAFGAGSSVSGLVSGSLSCADASSSPASLTLAVNQGANKWPTVARAPLRINSNTCPLLVSFRLLGAPSAGSKPGTAQIAVAATVRAASGVLAWNLTSIEAGKQTPLSSGPVSATGGGNQITFSPELPCTTLTDPGKATLLVDISDSVSLIGWATLPLPATIPPGVCGK
jgi:hypothetical protein